MHLGDAAVILADESHQDLGIDPAIDYFVGGGSDETGQSLTGLLVGLKYVEGAQNLDDMRLRLAVLLEGQTVALALKSVSPAIRVIGVSMEHGCAMHASLRAGHPVQVEEQHTLADSLGGRDAVSVTMMVARVMVAA